nr:MAG TPA: hypothetical protein [Caudoviricetes sp.]
MFSKGIAMYCSVLEKYRTALVKSSQVKQW